MQYQLLDLPFEGKGSGVPRTTGAGIIHLSDVIRFIEVQNNTDFKDDGTWDSAMTQEAGFIWERALELAYADRMAVRPGEFICDGITCSPDGIGTDVDIFDPETGEQLIHGTGQVCLEEYKFTWKSTVKKEGNLLKEQSPTNNWKYMTQVMSYCHVIGTPICVMRIFHVNGDYRGRRPIPRLCRIVFTQEELDNNWNMILTHAAKLRKRTEKENI
jgi:hypothetical protein